MASIDWPSGLPAPLVGSIREGRIPSYVEDQAQVGAPRRRKRFTRTLKRFAFDLILTNTQAVTLRTFIDTTTDGGVTEFNWTHPVTSAIHEVRFTEIPDLNDTTKNVDGVIWRVSVQVHEI